MAVNIKLTSPSQKFLNRLAIIAEEFLGTAKIPPELDEINQKYILLISFEKEEYIKEFEKTITHLKQNG